MSAVAQALAWLDWCESGPFPIGAFTPVYFEGPQKTEIWIQSPRCKCPVCGRDYRLQREMPCGHEEPSS